MKKLISILTVVLILCGSMLSVSAESVVPYQNYTYSESGNIILSPQAYLPEQIIYGDTLGVGDFNLPTDMDVDENGDIYILDSGNNRVVVATKDLTFKTQYQCNSVEADGSLMPTAGPKGITVANGYIYISDTENKRILMLDKNTGAYIKSYLAPVSQVLADNFIFAPLKTSVDEEGNLYVVSQGTYEGLLNINANGEFLGFFASNKVTADAWTLFWRRFSTVEQRKQMDQLIPQDFSSIDIDSNGFFFVTTSTAKSDKMVKRVNMGGNNVIRTLSTATGMGDPKAVNYGSFKGKSSFTDVSAGPYKLYACLDSNRGKVYVYNYDGYLLYTFGTIAEQDGAFTAPIAVSYLNDDRIAVLDSTHASITVFNTTEYARLINEAVEYQNVLAYDKALGVWQQVLEYNEHYEIALNLIGNAYYNSGRYDEAMECFDKTGNKDMYSQVKKEIRSQWIYDNSWLFVAAILLIVAFNLIKWIIKLVHRWKNRYTYISRE